MEPANECGGQSSGAVGSARPELVDLTLADEETVRWVGNYTGIMQ